MRTGSERIGLGRGSRRGSSRSGAWALVLAGVAGTPAAAQHTWTGAAGTVSWCSPQNWDPMTVPPDGAAISVGPGYALVDMFPCPNEHRTLGYVGAESPVRFWTPVTFSGGADLANPILSLGASPTPIAGEVIVGGEAAEWEGGIFTGGTLRNLGVLTVDRSYFGGRVDVRGLDGGGTLANEGTLAVISSIVIQAAGTLENTGEIRAAGNGSITGAGPLENTGRIVVPQGRTFTIDAALDSDGTIEVEGTLAVTPADLEGSVVVGGAGGGGGGGGVVSVKSRAAGSLIGPVTLSGEGTIALDGGELVVVGPVTSTIEPGASGRGLWLSMFPTPLVVQSGGITVAGGVGTWTSGNVEAAAGVDEAISIAAGGELRITTAPFESAGDLYFGKLGVRGRAVQDRTWRLRSGAELEVAQPGTYTLNNTVLGGDGTGTARFIGFLDVNTRPTDGASRIEQVGVEFEGDAVVHVDRGSFWLGTSGASGPRVRYAGINPVLTVEQEASITLIGGHELASGILDLAGSGDITLTSGGTFEILDGATLWNSVSSPGLGFSVQGTIVGASEEAFAWNDAVCTMSGGCRIDFPLHDAYWNFSNAGTLHVYGATVSAGLGSTGWIGVYGPMLLEDPAYLTNDGDVHLYPGASIRDAGLVRGPRFYNQRTIYKVEGGSASINTKLDNTSWVWVDEGTLWLDGPVVQIEGTELTGGGWHIEPGATLRTPGRSIETIGPGAAVDLGGSWPELALAENEGEIRVEGTVASPRTVVNRNVVAIAEEGSWDFSGSLTAYVQTSGTTTVHAGGTLSNPGRTVLVQGGTLQGGGLVVGNAENAGGRVAPGEPGEAPTQTLEIAGDFEQGPGGVLEIEIAGPGGEHDALVVSGAATLGGILRVPAADGLAPGETFTVLTAASVSGSFDALDLPTHPSGASRFAVSVLADRIVLTAVACPADHNADGNATVADLLGFLGAFRAGTADFDGDGSTGVNDLLGFLGAFRAGC